MALCTSCGNQVEESASFCTSCGHRMPAAAQPAAAVTVMRPVCAACGAQVDPNSVFCTECGQRMAAQSASAGEVVPIAPITATAPAVDAPIAKPPSPSALCTNCGTRLDSGTAFCTNCRQPTLAGNPSYIVSDSPMTVAPALPALEATPPSSVEPVVGAPVFAERAITPTAPEPLVVAPLATQIETKRATVAAESSVEHHPAEPTPQVAAPLYTTPSEYPPTQPRSGAFRVIVLALLLLVLGGGFGGWYFMGVETVIVCSPPDVTVFLDGKELAPTSYGRYVIPHLSRQPHLLKVHREEFADTIERLDFPLTSRNEWVNIRLVPRRQAPPASR